MILALSLLQVTSGYGIILFDIFCMICLVSSLTLLVLVTLELLLVNLVSFKSEELSSYVPSLISCNLNSSMISIAYSLPLTIHDIMSFSNIEVKLSS
jgi:hypothetical protein